MSKKIELGLYDDFENERTLNIVDINGKDQLGQKIITMYFTNDFIFGKAHFGIPAKNIKKFLKGYKKRKK